MTKTITFEDVSAYRSAEVEMLNSGELLPLPEVARRYIEALPEAEQWISSAFVRWMDRATAWVQNPTDAASAYHFIDGHPALWSFRTLDPDRLSDWTDVIYGRSGDVSEQDFYAMSRLVMDGHAERFWTAVSKNKGENVYMMEMGAAVPPHRIHHYHDTDLDTWGTSFEDCYLQTALGMFAVYGLEDRDAETDYDSEPRKFYRKLLGWDN